MPDNLTPEEQLKETIANEPVYDQAGGYVGRESADVEFICKQVATYLSTLQEKMQLHCKEHETVQRGCTDCAGLIFANASGHDVLQTAINELEK